MAHFAEIHWRTIGACLGDFCGQGAFSRTYAGKDRCSQGQLHIPTLPRDRQRRQRNSWISKRTKDRPKGFGFCANVSVRYSVAATSPDGSARQTYRYFSSLEVTTGFFFSRVTRFKAERRFCIFSPFRSLSGILTACWALSFERSTRMSATAFRCFPLRPCGTSDRSTDA
jgi:hypothetical protein